MQSSGLQLLHAARMLPAQVQLVSWDVSNGTLPKQNRWNPPAFALWLLLMAGGGYETNVELSNRQGMPASTCPALTRLAAEHPVEYFGLVDSCVRQGLEAADIMLAVCCLRYGLCQPLFCAQQLLEQPSAVAAITSAVAGLVKLAMLCTADAPFVDFYTTSTERPEQHLARTSFPATLPNIMQDVFTLCCLLAGEVASSAIAPGSSTVTILANNHAVTPPAAPSNSNEDAEGQTVTSAESNGRIGISCQTAASALLLTVLVARSLITLTGAIKHSTVAVSGISAGEDGMVALTEDEAANISAEYLAKCVAAEPQFRCACGPAKLVATAHGPVPYMQNAWINFKCEFVALVQLVAVVLSYFALDEPQPAAVAAECVGAAAAADRSCCCSSCSAGASVSCHGFPQLQQQQQHGHGRAISVSSDILQPHLRQGSGASDNGGLPLDVKQNPLDVGHNSGSSVHSHGQQVQHHQQQEGAVQSEWSYLLQLRSPRKLTTGLQSLLHSCSVEAQAMIVNACRLSQQEMSKAMERWHTWQEAVDAESDAFLALESNAAALWHCCSYGLDVCLLLADAAPLPLVCNCLDCSNLSGLCEAAAAVKECAMCGARWCSEECFRACWLQHKKPCRRMAALGLKAS